MPDLRPSPPHSRHRVIAFALGLIAGLLLVGVAVFAAPDVAQAAAAQSPRAIGERIQREGNGFIAPLVLLMGAVCGLVAAAMRKLETAILGVVVVLVAGLFIWAPGTVESLAKGIWSSSGT